MLTTERLILRPLKSSDGTACLIYLNDYDTVSMLARVPHPYKEEDWSDFYERVSKAQAEAVFAITQKDNDDLIGIISLRWLMEKNAAVLGFWLGEPFRRQGMMKEAALAILHFGFVTKGLEVIYSGYFIDNDGSAAIHESLGFERTGQGREFSPARGDDVDHIDMMMTEYLYRMHYAD